MEISNVPPPRSYTAITPSFCLSSPYASAAAVGSFTSRSTSSPAIRPASFVACRWASLKYAGTVITARDTAVPKNRSAFFFSCCSTYAEISGGVSVSPPTFSRSTSPAFAPSASRNGNSFSSSSTSSKSRPISRLAEYTADPASDSNVPCAALPTATPSSVHPTTEGTRRSPSSPGITTGVSPSMYATSEFVVPRSMPTTTLRDSVITC